MSIDFPKEELSVLELWDKVDAFHRQVELSKSNPPFTFYDGPPFATGLPYSTLPCDIERASLTYST